MSVPPAVRAIMRKYNKAAPGTIILGSEIAQPVRETITTGCLSYDAALGGGWVVGHWAEIYGWESSGKTWLAAQTIAANQKRDPNFFTVWVATETFHEPYMEMWGVDLDRVAVINDYHMEVILQEVLDLVKTKAVDLTVIDSIPGLSPERTVDDDMEAYQPGHKAARLAQFFEKCNGALKRNLTEIDERPCTGLALNQQRYKIGVSKYEDPVTTPGGAAKNFWFFQRVKVTRTEWLKNTKQVPIGQTVKIMGHKNKYSPPRRTGQVDIYFADGKGFRAGQIDVTKDIISAAIAYDVISREGKMKYLFGEEQWNGRPNLEKALKAEPKLRGRIKRATINAATKPLPAPTQAHTVKRAPARRRGSAKR